MTVCKGRAALGWCSFFVFFFVFFYFIIFYLSQIQCKENAKYKECNQPFHCGSLTSISYPFWGGTACPQHCGRLAFKLFNCEEEFPRIKIRDLYFHVLNITSQDNLHTMTLARSDLWDSPCTDHLVNTTLDDKHFPYAPTVGNLTLFYGCAPQNGSTLKNFTCRIDGTTSDRNIAYYSEDLSSSGVDLQNTTSCFTKIQVPIFWNGFHATPEVEKVLRKGFQIEYSAEWDRCNTCLVDSNRTCGSNATTDSFVCFSQVSENRIAAFLKLCLEILGPGLITCGSGNICLLILDCISLWMEHKNKDVEALIKNIGPLAVTRYKYSEVRKMNNSFKDKLGEGGYGDVYEGKLLDGSRVAVKVLKNSKGKGEDFVNEVSSISRTSHVNVVTLLGYCVEGKKKVLIYEFMPNGSLEKFIYKHRNPSTTTPQLESEKLSQISIGIARGLEYLHRGCNSLILHFDIKPHNILLDENFCPKISDFGLSKHCPRKESYISMLEGRGGTIGYMAPEVYNRSYGEVSAKSDIYSYGMMILEMVGGRKNVDALVSHTSQIYFPDWIYEHLEQGSNFGLLNAVTEEEKEVSRKMIIVGLWCIQTRPSDRPSMSRVIEMLEGSIEALQIPSKPVFSSPVRSPPESSTTFSAS